MVSQSMADDHGVSEARVRAGRALRELSHAVVGRHADDELLNEVANTLSGLVDRLGRGERRTRQAENFQQRHMEPLPAEGEAFETYPDRPYSGSASPLGVDLVVLRRGDEVEAHVTLRAAHEGAPERSHGGVISAVFDDVFGFVLQLNRLPGFTGELTIRYEAGTPLHRELVLRARMTSKEGRKIFMTGELSDGATRVASGRAVFIERELTA